MHVSRSRRSQVVLARTFQNWASIQMMGHLKFWRGSPFARPSASVRIGGWRDDASGERATRKMAKVGGAEKGRRGGREGSGRERSKSERQNILTHETAVRPLTYARNEIRPRHALGGLHNNGLNLQFYKRQLLWLGRSSSR